MKQFFYVSFFFLILVASLNTAKAQLSYAGHLHAISYLGDLKEFYQGGYGVSGQLEYALSDQLNILGRSGFLFVPNNLELGVLVFLVPIQVGAKYMLKDKIYAQGMVGVHQVNAVASFGSGSGTNFSFGAGLGLQLGRLDIGPHIDIVGNGWSHVGIRLGIRKAN